MSSESRHVSDGLTMMFDLTNTPFSEQFARALELVAQFQRLRDEFDTDLRSDRRGYRRVFWGLPVDDNKRTMRWDVRAARSEQLSRIVKEYESLWSQIHAVAPALAGVLPLPWQMRTGNRLPDWGERIRRRRAGTAIVSPTAAYKPSTTV